MVAAPAAAREVPGANQSRSCRNEIDIVDITFEGRTTDHGSFKIHRDSRVEVLRADGTRDEMALFGSLLETADGRYKIYSFIND